MRRLAVFLAIFATVLATALPAAAGASITTRQVPVHLTSDECPNLAPGTTLDGSGTEKSITIERTAGDITTIINATHTHGTTTDQAGNVYMFDYSNEFRASNSAAHPDVFTGLMTDHFVNSGSGPAKLNNGFVGNLTLGPGDFFNIDPIHSFGDPLNFDPNGPETTKCDPL